MQPVSANWLNNQKQTLVEESFVEVSYDIADPDALADASASDNGSIYIANTSQIVSEVAKDIVPYATLERNIWLLDGSRKIIPESDYGDTGYVSDNLSTESCGFDKIPIVEISFTEIHAPIIPGITITWGDAYNEYAENFRVTAYNGATLVAEKNVIDNKSVMSVVELDIENYDLIRIEILKWCLPYHRARISNIFVGINKIYTKTDLMEFEHLQEVDPLNAKLPKMSVRFGIDNTSDEYNPNNEAGMSKYLMERQEIRTRYGYKLGDSIEWIDGGVFYLSEWEAPQNGISANFEARDLLEFMRSTYMKGVYSSAGVSLYSLATAVFEEANLPLNSDGTVKWVIDDSLKSIYTNAPLPLVSLAECLQMIANAAACVLYADRNGILHIEPIDMVLNDYTIDNFNSFKKSEISLTKPLLQVDVTTYSHFVDNVGKELYNGVIPINGSESIYITYSDPAVNVVATVTNGTLTSATYYTNACLLTITGNGDVSVNITGDILKTSETIITTPSGEEKGEIQRVENPLITTAERALAVGAWVKDYLSNRKILSSEWRADPRLDVMDIITVKNNYGSSSMRTTSVRFTYNGAFRGQSEGRILDGMA
ncbi:MAG: hypothetical protein GX353_10095 [Oligella ureolytica]|nr:hypothetical protein [Oligella ureolytica]